MHSTLTFFSSSSSFLKLISLSLTQSQKAKKEIMQRKGRRRRKRETRENQKKNLFSDSMKRELTCAALKLFTRKKGIRVPFFLFLFVSSILYCLAKKVTNETCFLFCFVLLCFVFFLFPLGSAIHRARLFLPAVWLSTRSKPVQV